MDSALTFVLFTTYICEYILFIHVYINLIRIIVNKIILLIIWINNIPKYSLISLYKEPKEQGICYDIVSP